MASLIGLVSAYPYLRDVVRRRTRPHVFTWGIWGVLTAIAFAAQLSKGAGAGSWIVGITLVNCFVVVALAIPYGERDIKLVDWICLAGAVGGLVMWRVTSDPRTAVVLVTTVDLVAFLPTLRKAYYKPHEETLIFFSMSIFKFGLGVAALRTYSLTTYLVPSAIAAFNVVFVTTLVLRRRTLARQAKAAAGPLM